jgi:bifunctional UDP-N-acetylglucosamine pyrophosphorylase/glucosamine-1-phosphate N-acetyltransferase
MNALEIVILAAGKGNRMNSDTPKPLSPVGGEISLRRILKNVAWGTNDPIIVVSRNNEKIVEALGPGFTYVIQEKQRGTGDAVHAVKKTLNNRVFAENTMVLLADQPFISEQTLQNLWSVHKEKNAVLTIGTVTVPDFSGDHELFFRYGRILRDENNRVQGIVEEKDASEEEKKIKEVNISYYCFKTEWLWENIGMLKNENKSGEFYITDMVHIAASQNIPIHSYAVPDLKEGMGFNTQEQLELLQKLADGKKSA